MKRPEHFFSVLPLGGPLRKDARFVVLLAGVEGMTWERDGDKETRDSAESWLLFGDVTWLTRDCSCFLIRFRGCPRLR